MSNTTTRAVDRAIAEATLTGWANKADEYDEWHREAAELWLHRNDAGDDRDYALAALAHWADHGPQYDEPHRTAAGAFWIWYR